MLPMPPPARQDPGLGTGSAPAMKRGPRTVPAPGQRQEQRRTGPQVGGKEGGALRGRLPPSLRVPAPTCISTVSDYFKESVCSCCPS